jgi:Zn-dependent protease with chaperone function
MAGLLIEKTLTYTFSMEISAARRRYDGNLFRTTGEPSRETGKIFLDRDALVFSNLGGEIRLPLADLAMTAGGANNRLIYFSHQSVPGISFVTSERAILEDLRSTTGPELAPQVLTVKRLRRRMLQGTAIAVAVVVAFLWGVWALRDPVAGVIARGVPVSWEEQAGEVLARAFTTEAYDNPALTQALEEFVAPLSAVVAESGFTPRFFIVPEKTVNAFALPGGTIVIFSEVIEKATSGNEVLGVLAHELGHVTERHVLRNIISSVGLYAVFSLLIGDAVGGIAALANAAPLLLSKSYSRDLERDADAIGFEYLISANIDPRGMVAFFKRILAIENKANEVFPDASGLIDGLRFLSTHPNTEERIVALEERIAGLPRTTFRNVERSFEKLQIALKAADKIAPPPPGS